MAETTPNPIEALVNEARERLSQEISAQAAELENVEKSFREVRDRQKKLQEEFEQQLNQIAGDSLKTLRARQKRLEETVQQQLGELGKYQPPPPPVIAAPLDKLLNSVRNIITATLPEQVMEVLAEEVERMGVRAAVFDVRGKSWLSRSIRTPPSATPSKRPAMWTRISTL